jgi:DNA-binding beta-propeller fold protein YncE
MKLTRAFPTAAVLALATSGLALATDGVEPDAAVDHATLHHHAAAPSAPPQRVETAGLAIELAVEPLSGSGPVMESEPARVSLKIADVLSGVPLSRLAPGAWMDHGAETASPADCKKKIETFVGGSLLGRPALDLNIYYVLALNEDATISVVDPLFGYGSSQLLTMTFLRSPGADWALTAQGDRLFVSMPDSDRVAVVDTGTFKVVAELLTGPRPRRLLLQPDGHYLWVAYDGDGADQPPGVAAFDAATLFRAVDLATGDGAHELAASDDSRFVFVSNRAAGSVAVVDTGALRLVRSVPVGPQPVSLAWSRQAGAVYVASAGDGSVTAVAPESAEPRARIAAGGPGLGAIRFAPGGRLAFVLDPPADAVHILDAATNRRVQTADVEDEPDQIAFSDELAYVRHRGSQIVLMIPLKQVGEAGRPVPVVDFPGGEHPPGRVPRAVAADGIVQAPGHPAVLVANAADQVIYFYKEGMAAPMGHFRNYGKVPLAVMVVDRGLRETRPGVYETVATMGPPGTYELALLIDSPRVLQCFPVAVAADPARAVPPAGVGIEVAVTRETAAGASVPVRITVRSPAGGALREGLTDVRVLTFLSPGVWQQRHWATEVGDGVYEIRFVPPEPGLYFVFVEIASAGLAFQQAPFAVFTAGPPAAARAEGGR